MYGSDLCGFSFCWIIPIVMMILCFFMMRGRKWTMMGGFGPCSRNWHQAKGVGAAMDILDRRYASGEIEKVEYEERKRTLVGSTEVEKD
jgi:uncharacterized membrane protein